ncbi:hypothetical protein GBA52_028895 [Prunus armeniaca]|nr:hypothetical protein GBA52_028895 [Prunus armeniaca]
MAKKIQDFLAEGFNNEPEAKALGSETFLTPVCDASSIPDDSDFWALSFPCCSSEEMKPCKFIEEAPNSDDLYPPS